MNAKKINLLITILLAILAVNVRAETRDKLVRQGNQLYRQQNYQKALQQYDQAQPEGSNNPSLQYNRANCLYKLEDYAESINLYREVSAQAKDTQLVVRAKYNMGNCHFQQGIKQRDTNPQKALEELTDAVKNYRESLDMNPQDDEARRNIAVTRLVMKDIMDQIKKDQEKQKQQQQDKEKDKDKDKEKQKQDEKQDQQQDKAQDQQEKQEQQQQKDEQKQKQPEQKAVPDTTARDILNEEKERKEQRKIKVRAGGYRPADKDW
ncbi:MAG: tetratricopeptide repeat protein [Sedimentisphaerales bacterium]|nr:tetratricopeptide repeat protein [Sedimentisphaerales bacterium]